MNLYTIIFEYRGGTYISQEIAKNVNTALSLWGENINTDEILYLGKALKKKVNNEISDILKYYPPVKLVGVKNCWCVGSILSGFVNIVETKQ
ncbi:MAG: hypothetical protein GY714_05135 [Desulfobacterales bacterium]|nr:hypothetical protein [Desulfobacterales bacterium]